MITSSTWHIIGQGLAGTCLAWQFLDRGVECIITSDGHDGSSRVAAGMINPVTGKNFSPGWRIAEFLPDADRFYREIESILGIQCWHTIPIIRLVRDATEWQRIEQKLDHPEVARWVTCPVDPPPGWHRAIQLHGGARLDARAFLDASKTHFETLGLYRQATFSGPITDHTILCEGAAGLLRNQLGPHRCAKGEILTITAPEWSQSHIRIGAGGWLVPIGNGQFKVGSTYEWNVMDNTPTDHGRERGAHLARTLGGDDHFTIVHHEAGIRPILRRSQPYIGRHPQGGWLFNALGSKGSLYGPGTARSLAAACLQQAPIDPDLDFAGANPF